MNNLKLWLSKLSFQTGVIFLVICAICYVVSFAQMLLPISVTAKGIFWFIFFGLAKTFQYGGLAVLGVDGVKRIKKWWNNYKLNKK